MLIKLTPTVNFTNILQAAAFECLSFTKKLQDQTINTEKHRRTLLHIKVARKMLMKLTPEMFLPSMQ